MTDLEPIRLQIASTERELASPFPTPPVGTVVIWYERGIKDAANQRAAIVTRQDGPGKLVLTVFGANAMAQHKTGSLHVSNPVHAMLHNSMSKNNGGWDYCDGYVIPDEHYEIHNRQVQAKLACMRGQLAEAEAVVSAAASKLSKVTIVPASESPGHLKKSKTPAEV